MTRTAVPARSSPVPDMQPKPADKSSQGDNAAQERAKAMIGQVISDRYRIRELIAMGGMGAVYRGDHLLLKKRIAIKLLHPETENLPELVKRFEREAIAGAHIQHPNVATATDFGKLPDGSYFLILEYVKGITLHEVLEKGPLSPRRAANFAKQIASALHAIHTKGIYHRDIKPRNIMVSEGRPETVKIIDLGLAKLKVGDFNDEAPAKDDRGSMSDEDDATALTVAGTIFGTLAYLAPEAAEGMDAVDGRSDLYALGLIMYEMLCGKRPFVAINPVELFMQHRIAPVPPMSTRSPGLVIPPVFEAIPRKLLEKRPENRFQNGQEVCDAIDEALATLGVDEGDEVVNSERPSGVDQRDSTPTPPTVMQKSTTLSGATTPSQKTPLPSQKTPPLSQKAPPLSQKTLPSHRAPAAPAKEAPSTITTPAAVHEQTDAEPAVPQKKRSSLEKNVITVVAGVLLGCAVVLGVKFYQKNFAAASGKPMPTTTQAAPQANKPAPAPTPPPEVTTAALPILPPSASVAQSAAAPPEPAPSAAPPTATLSDAEIATLKSKYQIAWRGRDWRGAAREAITLAKGAPQAFDEVDLAQRTERLAIILSKENAETELLEMLANDLGSKGIDILYALVEGQGRAPVAVAAMKLLQDEKIRSKGTPAMQIAFALRIGACDEKLKLLPRAAKEGDSRTRQVLETLGRDCFPRSADLEKTIFDLRVRFPKRFSYD
ncbi:MAG: serine/threonine protein kinase [Polyangiaceae bacterium]|nr:serine/threonine protein kinase [Polyangiaceae bacterium]